MVRLSNKFYSRQALGDFSQVCRGEIVNESFEVDLKPESCSQQETENEFCNYVLGMMK